MRCRRIDAIAARRPGGGELDAAVRLVVDEAPVGEALHGGGDRARREAEPLGQDAGVGARRRRESR